MSSQIDITFDFRTDTPPGKDPDALSPTLRRYHKLLWSKHLPSGVAFELKDTTRNVYLHHKSDLGEFFLSSDAVVPTFSRDTRIQHIINEIPVEERDTFFHIGYTIGGMMIFPGNQIDRKPTINVARGFHPRIKDQFDLTVECIRRHYCNDDGDYPLKATLNRYSDFFKLFGDFRGYVEFFLLQDLVTEDYSAVRFFTPFEGFKSYPRPECIDSYIAYRQHAVNFIEARNRRILEFNHQ